MYIRGPYNQYLVKTIHTIHPLIQSKAHKHIYKANSLPYNQNPQNHSKLNLISSKSKKTLSVN